MTKALSAGVQADNLASLDYSLTEERGFWRDTIEIFEGSIRSTDPTGLTMDYANGGSGTYWGEKEDRPVNDSRVPEKEDTTTEPEKVEIPLPKLPIWLSWLQTGLDVVGCVPLIGDGADLVNTLIYIAVGDYGNASLAAISMIPLVGDAIGKGAKTVKFAVKHSDELVDAIKLVSKNLDKVGGSARELKGLAKKGEEIHHLFSQSTLKKLGMNPKDSPAIILSKPDHKNTGSWGRYISSRDYRAEELTTLSRGDYLSQFQKAADDARDAVQSNGGDLSQVDSAINQAYDYLINKMSE